MALKQGQVDKFYGKRGSLQPKNSKGNKSKRERGVEARGK